MNKELELNLKVGVQIKIGANYSKDFGYNPNEIITLVDGSFEEYNGLYSSTSKAPSVWDNEAQEFYSIYHLFGNELEDFSDCEIVKQ